MSQKDYCAGGGSVPAEVKPYQGISRKTLGRDDQLGKCGTCGRILKVAPSGILRMHSVRGRNTASHDNTMEILWGAQRIDDDHDGPHLT